MIPFSYVIVLRKLLSHKVDITISDHDGRQPLMWAASAGKIVPLMIRMLHWLVIISWNMKKKYSMWSKTWIMNIILGSSDAILCLVNAKASVEATDNDGLTALHCAASRGHHDCIDTLIGLCGAEVNTKDHNGSTPLFYAVTLGNLFGYKNILRQLGAWEKMSHF